MNIIKNKTIYITISVVLIIIGIGFMVYNQTQGNGLFNYDIQFSGGTSFNVEIGKEFQNEDIEKIVSEKADGAVAQVQKYGDSSHNASVKTKTLEDSQISEITQAFCEKYEIDKNKVTSSVVGATVSGEMQNKALLAVGVSCIAMLLYVSLRFRDFKIGASCIIALLHDALIVLACYAVFRIPLNNSFIAAILTVLGYSINASIVIFDRIRENKRKMSRGENEKLVNTSVKQSLRRSLFTSLTTFFTIATLYILGVQSVKEFALPIVVGIICGTYSSVFIAGSVWYIFSQFGKKAKI